RRLACARLVAEGTVTAVRPVPGADGRRVTLAVTRVHKGEEGAPVMFLLGASAESSPGVGDEVLVVLPGEGDRPDLLVTGKQNVARARAWATGTLPEGARLARRWGTPPGRRQGEGAGARHPPLLSCRAPWRRTRRYGTTF